MNAVQKDFFEIMTAFKRLNISDMLPGITLGEFNILKMIRRCSGPDGCSQQAARVSDIVKGMRLPPSAVSRAFRSLEAKGLVIRTIDKEDRRNTFVALTEGGEELIEEIEEIMTSFADAVFGNMGEETMERLNAYLRAFLTASKKEIDKRKYDDKKGERK